MATMASASVSKDVAGSVVDLVFDSPRVVGCVGVQAGAFWELLSQQTVSVLVAAKVSGEPQKETITPMSAVISVCLAISMP
jgi:hypothetical protein